MQVMRDMRSLFSHLSSKRANYDYMIVNTLKSICYT